MVVTVLSSMPTYLPAAGDINSSWMFFHCFTPGMMSHMMKCSCEFCFVGVVPVFVKECTFFLLTLLAVVRSSSVIAELSVPGNPDQECF